MWFKELTGFEEKEPNMVREKLSAKDGYIYSAVNGRQFRYGRLEIPTLETLRKRTLIPESTKNKISISIVVGNVQEMHKDPENIGAMFQAASQFNLLEMVGPQMTPEMGVSIYEHDKTQGPACAIACGAGTIYRNYFVPLDGQIGQSTDKQINCLEELAMALGNQNQSLWKMQNGYALATRQGLQNILQQLRALSSEELCQLKGKLKIGVQWDTEVTISEKNQILSQTYCSALPVAYSHIDAMLWKDFATLILEASYEATFYTALQNFQHTGNPKLFLTLVGGGAFGNDINWILNAISLAVKKFSHTPLDVRLVSYRLPNPSLREYISELNSQY